MWNWQQLYLTPAWNDIDDHWTFFTKGKQVYMLIHEIHVFELQIEKNSFKCMIMATFSDTLLVATERTEKLWGSYNNRPL